jgi:ribosomal protein S18 acetylase RimI-like enzyme
VTDALNDAGSSGAARRIVATPVGDVTLRSQTPADASFLFDLFCARHAPMFAAAGLPAAALSDLLASQYGLRCADYRTKFPRARWSVIEAADGPIGELIEDDEPDAVYIMDITVLAARQARGIGSAIVRALMAANAARGGVRAMAIVTNEISIRMFQRLGFAMARHEGDAYVSLRWRPPAAQG